MKVFLFLTVGVAVVSSCTMHQATATKSTLEVVSARFSEDQGSSFNDAVKVEGVSNQQDGVAAEYQYISARHGERGKNWFLVSKTVVQNKDKLVDVVEIQLDKPEDRRLIYFDATAFLLKN